MRIAINVLFVEVKHSTLSGVNKKPLVREKKPSQGWRWRHPKAITILLFRKTREIRNDIFAKNIRVTDACFAKNAK
jgi:hypothetical protein